MRWRQAVQQDPPLIVAPTRTLDFLVPVFDLVRVLVRLLVREGVLDLVGELLLEGDERGMPAKSTPRKAWSAAADARRVALVAVEALS